MDSNLISVVVTTFNRSRYLRETLNSISNQTYKNIEIIVVDDGSNDGQALSNKLICRDFTNVQYFYKKNTGQPDSRNFGIIKSKGDFIGFCDDDDLWHSKKLEWQLEVTNTKKEILIVTGDIEYLDEDGNKTGIIKSHAGYNHGFVFRHLLAKNITASIVPLFHNSVFDKIGFFNPKFTIGEDWEFWRRASYYYKFYALPKVLAYVRRHSESMSELKSKTIQDRLDLYLEANKSLLLWGKNRFNNLDKKLIKQTEQRIFKGWISNLGSKSIKSKALWFLIKKDKKLGILIVYQLMLAQLQKRIIK